MEVRNSLAELRTRRGLSAAQLAAMIGVSRQTIYAIEAGTYVPNTAVSLKLASVLDSTVEELFQIEPVSPPTDETLEVRVVHENAESLVAGQPLRLCAVDGQTIAVVSESNRWALPLVDAVLLEQLHSRKDHLNARVMILNQNWKRAQRLLIAGCDPSASILAHALLRQGCELVVAYENSSRALELLHDGLVHIAGTHIIDKVKTKADLQALTREFGRKSIAVISYAVWEEGLVIGQGNPKRIAGVADLVRKDVRFANREPGAGCRRLLDDLLSERTIAPGQVHGYDRIVVGHLEAARLVRDGTVDCCVSTQAVARALALDFIPLAQKPYYLVMRRAQLNHPGVQQMLEVLARASFRRDVEVTTGYDMRTAGDRVL